MAAFPLLIVNFFKINRIEAIDELEKLCKFPENMTKRLCHVNKKKTKKDGWSDRRQELHDISSAGFQPF